MVRFIKFLESCHLDGLSRGKTPEDLAKRHNVSLKHINTQLKAGIKVESEHTKNKGVAKRIAMDHLYEDPNYYTKLDKMENEEMNSTAHGIAGVSPGEPTVVHRDGRGLLFGRKILRRKKKKNNRRKS